MINGLENLIQTGFFSSSYTNVRLPVLVGGAGRCWSLVPEHIICTEHGKPGTCTRIPSQKGTKSLEDIQKALEKEMKFNWKERKDYRNGKDWERQANLMEMNKGVGKTGKQNAKETQKLNSEVPPGRREQSPVPISWTDSKKWISNWRTRRCNRFTKCLWQITLPLHKLSHSAAEGLTGIAGGKQSAPGKYWLFSSSCEPAHGLISCVHKEGTMPCHQCMSLWYEELLWCHILQQRGSLYTHH